MKDVHCIFDITFAVWVPAGLGTIWLVIRVVLHRFCCLWFSSFHLSTNTSRNLHMPAWTVNWWFPWALITYLNLSINICNVFFHIYLFISTSIYCLNMYASVQWIIRSAFLWISFVLDHIALLIYNVHDILLHNIMNVLSILQCFYAAAITLSSQAYSQNHAHSSKLTGDTIKDAFFENKPFLKNIQTKCQ